MQGSLVENVVNSIVAAQQPASAQQGARAATELYEQLKAGEVHTSVTIAAELVSTNRPVEVQHFGYGLLQHLVGSRWVEFSDQEHAQLATLAFNMVRQVGGTVDAWPVKSKAALLLAVVTKRQGPAVWDPLLPQLLALAQEGHIQSEMVCMVLKFVGEEVTLYGEDMEAETKRALLASLLASLDGLLPFLERMLEGHFGQALEAQRAGQQAAALAHSGVVSAALGAVASFSEWVPMARLAGSGLLMACAFLLMTQDFRMAACEILRVVAARRQMQEELSVYNSVMEAVGDALINAAAAVLQPAAAAQLEYEGANDEFGQRLCDTMASYGTSHFWCLSTTEKKMTFLQQMLGFTQSAYMPLADKALPLWVNLLASGSGGRSGASARSAIPLEAVAALMTVAGEHLRQGVQPAEESSDFPPYCDTYAEYREACIAYRLKLASVVRLAAGLLPEQGLQAAGARLQAGLAACSSGGGSPSREAEQTLEAAVHFLDSVTGSVADAHLGAKPTSHTQAVLAGMQALLQQVLAVRFTAAGLVALHARALEAFTRLLAARPDHVTPLLDKVFELLTTTPLEGNPLGAPPAHLPPGWKDAFAARQKVASVLLVMAKAAPQVLLPHLQQVADKLQAMWTGGLIWPGERNVLCEALLAAAMAGGELPLQSQVVGWVLAATQAEWADAAWQAHLASPEAFMAQYIALRRDAAGNVEVGSELPRWQLYHHIHILERTVKRLAAPPADPMANPAAAAAAATGPAAPPVLTPNPAAWSPLAPHMAWLLPPLLQILRCMHALWAPGPRAALQPAAAALEMGAKERAAYLKKPITKADRAEDDEAGTIAGTNVAALRSWLRQMRECAYQTAGALAGHGAAFYGCLPARALWPAALTENAAAMDPQSLRMLMRHVLIPFAKQCPPQQWRDWLVPVFRELIPHVLARLSNDWASVLAGAPRAGGTGAMGNGSGAAGGATATSESASAASWEVVQERLLRELTREHMLLLCTVQENTAGDGSQATSAMECLLVEAPDAGFAAVVTATAALWWPDEAAMNAIKFCRGVVGLAAKDARLAGFVGREMLRGCLAALAMEASSTFQGDLLHLTRAILIQHRTQQPGPRQELQAMLEAPPEVLAEFEAQLQATHSEKEQRNLIKKLLKQTGPQQMQRAMAGWRNVVAVVNVADPQKAPRPAKIAPLDGIFE